MKFFWKGKTTRKAFEDKIWNKLEEITNDKRQLERAKHYENNYDGTAPTVVHCYYDQVTKKHIGSWCKGEGWIYEFDANLNVNCL
jgi:hypothetical protein